MLGPLQDRDWSMSVHRKHVPAVPAVGQLLGMGHAPGVGNSSEMCMPYKMDIASGQESHKEGGGLELGASLPKPTPQCLRWHH